MALSPLARAIEELREMELRVQAMNQHEARQSGGTLDGAVLDTLFSGVPAGTTAMNGTIDADDPPVLVEVISFGPTVAPFPAKASPVEPPAAPAIPAMARSTVPAVTAPAQLAPAQKVSSSSGAGELALEVADHVDSNTLCAFLDELPRSMKALAECVDAFCAAPDDRVAAQVAHDRFLQIEAAAEGVGVRAIMTFAQHGRGLCSALVTASESIPSSMCTTLREATACLAGLADAVWGQATVPANAHDVLDNLIEAELRAILELTVRDGETAQSIYLD